MGSERKQLLAELDSQQAINQKVWEEVRSLEKYLLSPKFYEDTTVQVNDVLGRLQNIKKILLLGP